MTNDQRLRELLDAFRTHDVRYVSIDVSNQFSGVVFWVAPEVENVRRVFRAVFSTGVPIPCPDAEAFVRERGQMMIGPYPFWATIVTSHEEDDFEATRARQTQAP